VASNPKILQIVALVGRTQKHAKVSVGGAIDNHLKNINILICARDAQID